MKYANVRNKSLFDVEAGIGEKKEDNVLDSHPIHPGEKPRMACKNTGTEIRRYCGEHPFAGGKVLLACVDGTILCLE